MNPDNFKRVYGNLETNIYEIKSMIKERDILESADCVKIVERLKYLFYSITKSLVDIGHGIILENNFREPVNRTDVFISLAERDVVMSSAIPGIKQAVFALPKINSYKYPEIVEIVSKSIDDLHKCLNSFAVYFNIKNQKT